MKYKEATEACRGCSKAKAIPLIALPIPKPDPEQETDIHCFAKTVPVASFSYVEYLGKKVKLNLSFVPNPATRCKFFPHPRESECDIPAKEKELERLMWITVPYGEYISRNINFTAAKMTEK